MAAAEKRVDAVLRLIFIGGDDVEGEILVGSTIAESSGCSVGLHGAADPRSRYKRH